MAGKSKAKAEKATDKPETAEKEEPKSEEKTAEEASSPPAGPVDRDVCVGELKQKGTMLLMDLIRLHYLVGKKEKGEKWELPKEEKDVADLAARLSKFLAEGKKYELSGLKDVPKPFLLILSSIDATSWQAKHAFECYRASGIVAQLVEGSSKVYKL